MNLNDNLFEKNLKEVKDLYFELENDKILQRKIQKMYKKNAEKAKKISNNYVNSDNFVKIGNTRALIDNEIFYMRKNDILA